MAITASKLRENVYRILDQVLKTGEPVEIIRGGRKLKIVPAGEPRTRKLDRLAKRPETLLTDPEELVHLDWSKEWRP
jgi:antitoxin (DNA-binding transcriptional repressor) of toxin-antitoxin stability system